MSHVACLSEVTKRYPGGVTALDGVSLTIGHGELLGIVGPSGSGKSTLLHVLGTLDRPTSGQVEIAGHDVARLTDRQLSALRAGTVGFVFQQFHLAAGVPALDNVGMPLVYRGVRRAERRRRARAALERVGMGHRLGHTPNQLSGGEQQRVAIARALVGEPQVLLADEPTGNLDTRTGDEIMAVLERLVDEQNQTIVLITHDQAIAERAPRLVRMRDGRLEPAEAAA